jgi:hypothetical protein
MWIAVASRCHGCFVVFLKWSVSSARLHVEHLSHVQEQIKDSFHQYFVHFLRITEVGVFVHKFFEEIHTPTFVTCNKVWHMNIAHHFTFYLCMHLNRH